MQTERIPNLAQRLKVARTRLTPPVLQREAAKAVGRSSPCIGYWESGHTEPSLSEIFTLGKLYGVSIEWLLGLDTQASYHQEGTFSIEAGKSHSVPLYSSVAIVRGAQETASNFIQASAPYVTGTAFAWKVDTDAMSTIAMAGDVAVIEEHEEVKNNGIYMVVTEGSDAPTLRRCKIEQNRGFFIADTIVYPTLVASEVQVIGRVREVIKRIQL